MTGALSGSVHSAPPHDGPRLTGTRLDGYSHGVCPPHAAWGTARDTRRDSWDGLSYCPCRQARLGSMSTHARMEVPRRKRHGALGGSPGTLSSPHASHFDLTILTTLWRLALGLLPTTLASAKVHHMPFTPVLSGTRSLHGERRRPTCPVWPCLGSSFSDALLFPHGHRPHGTPFPSLSCPEPGPCWSVQLSTGLRWRR